MSHLSPFRVCVFCGASANVRQEYGDLARSLARAMAERGFELVYGGASVGLMGTLADAALAAGARVTGIIPRVLVDREIAHRGLAELVVVDGMHARKAEMTRRSNAFVALPGGFGTLDELFEITTWAQLGLHSCPIGLLDVCDYFRPLADFVAHARDEGFIKPEHRALWQLSHDPGRLLDTLSSAAAARQKS